LFKKLILSLPYFEALGKWSFWANY